MIYFFHHYELPAIEQQDRIQQMLMRTQRRQGRGRQPFSQLQTQAATTGAAANTRSDTNHVIGGAARDAPEANTTPAVENGDQAGASADLLRRGDERIDIPDDFGEVPIASGVGPTDVIAEQLYSLANELENLPLNEDETLYENSHPTEHEDLSAAPTSADVLSEGSGFTGNVDPGGTQVESSSYETTPSHLGATGHTGAGDAAENALGRNTADTLVRRRPATDSPQPETSDSSPVNSRTSDES